jgi:GNAT superfamily N-acetyltransferase
MGIEIRVVGADDVVDLLPLMRGYCEFYGTSPDDEALMAMSRRFVEGAGGVEQGDGDRGSPGRGTQLMARDEDGAAVGHATILWSWETTLAEPLAVMEDLFVAESARGTGVGRALIEACRRAAAARGIRHLDWMTAPDNLSAQGLYDSTGAVRSSWLSYRLPTGEPEP